MQGKQSKATRIPASQSGSFVAVSLILNIETTAYRADICTRTASKASPRFFIPHRILKQVLQFGLNFFLIEISLYKSKVLSLTFFRFGFKQDTVFSYQKFSFFGN